MQIRAGNEFKGGELYYWESPRLLAVWINCVLVCGSGGSKSKRGIHPSWCSPELCWSFRSGESSYSEEISSGFWGSGEGMFFVAPEEEERKGKKTLFFLFFFFFAASAGQWTKDENFRDPWILRQSHCGTSDGTVWRPMPRLLHRSRECLAFEKWNPCFSTNHYSVPYVKIICLILKTVDANIEHPTRHIWVLQFVVLLTLKTTDWNAHALEIHTASKIKKPKAVFPPKALHYSRDSLLWVLGKQHGNSLPSLIDDVYIWHIWYTYTYPSAPAAFR